MVPQFPISIYSFYFYQFRSVPSANHGLIQKYAPCLFCGEGNSWENDCAVYTHPLIINFALTTLQTLLQANMGRHYSKPTWADITTCSPRHSPPSTVHKLLYCLQKEVFQRPLKIRVGSKVYPHFVSLEPGRRGEGGRDWLTCGVKGVLAAAQQPASSCSGGSILPP